MDDHASLERWRLILGEAADSALGQTLSGTALAQDAALDWLYGRDEEQRDRGVSQRFGGHGASTLNAVDWLDHVHTLFPKATIERLERDAVERYNITEIVTDPDVLQRVTPSPALLKAVLRTKHLMNPQVLALARKLIAQVVRELMDKLALDVKRAFWGTLSRHPSPVKQSRNFDFRRTLRKNLGHYDPDTHRLSIETPYFWSRSRRQLDRWQVVILVDQSGSMVSSVIHSAVTAACLWGLPGIDTHLVAFDTEVVDLTSDVTDPVELLMKVQLGGGTDISRAVRYAAGLVRNPRRTIMAVVSDFYEGGDSVALIRTIGGLVDDGVTVLGLAALDEQANPTFDHDLAQRLANVGAHIGAMTPGELAGFIAERVGR